jgi:hypothetical protein
LLNAKSTKLERLGGVFPFPSWLQPPAWFLPGPAWILTVTVRGYYLRAASLQLSPELPSTPKPFVAAVTVAIGV